MAFTQHNKTEGKGSSVFQRFFRLSIHTCVVMSSVALSALVVFLIFFKSAPVVSVPSMVGKSLVDAVLLLQEKNLHPLLVLEYTDDPLDKGVVIKQDVAAGTAVRAKRVVGLTVSQGTSIAEVPDYRSLLYGEVAGSITGRSSGVDALLEIVSVQKVFQDAAAQVILAQKPAPGTKITGKNTAISFVVSRGTPSFEALMPDLEGLYFYELYNMMQAVDARFDFYLSERDVTLVTESAVSRKAGVVIGQDPPAGQAITSSVPRFRIGIRAKDASKAAASDDTPSAVVGLLKINVPSYNEPIRLVLSKRQGAADEASEVLSLLTRGGVISIPYFLVPGTMYEATGNGETLWRYTVSE